MVLKMNEYVMRFLSRDPAHPLMETVLFEFGCSGNQPQRLTEAVTQVANMLGALGTVEKVVEFMRANAALSSAKNLITKEK